MKFISKSIKLLKQYYLCKEQIKELHDQRDEMKNLKIEYNKSEIVVSRSTERINSRSVNPPEDFNKFVQWINEYSLALKQYDNNEKLLKIGREMFTWLNGKQDWLTQRLKNAEPPFFIEFQIPRRSSALQNAFLEVPWELLADEGGHLAKDQNLQFCPIRRIGKESEEKRAPSRYILNTVFMAASPRNARPEHLPELNYEQEESAILNLYSDKERDINMTLFVEESGNLGQLTNLINELKPVDVVHISCHGNILSEESKPDKEESKPDKLKPYLCLEDLTGDSDRVCSESFAQKLSQNRPSLLLLSACKTSETYVDNGSHENDEYNTFTQSIIKQGFPAVLGWSGSVYDSEATIFAAELYRNLSLSATLESAVTKERCSLFVPPGEITGQYESKDWHRARLYLGSGGGGVI